MKKKSFLFALAASMLFSSTIFAQDVPVGTTVPTISETDSIGAYIYVSGGTYLSTSGYSTVATDNNLFGENVTVTSDSSNPDTIFAKIVDGSGATICDIQMISAGSSHTFHVPYNSGTYKVQCKADSQAGTYYITVED